MANRQKMLRIAKLQRQTVKHMQQCELVNNDQTEDQRCKIAIKNDQKTAPHGELQLQIANKIACAAKL